ncbi:MAG: cell division protein ZapA [Clostridia bacterium]|nr:cell division protein ZapA [Clostridia bacterium]
MKKNKISVRLLGRDYSLLTDQPPERVQSVARYVDRKMRELQITARIPENVLPMLTTLTIGDELFSAQQENQRLRRELAQLGERLNQMEKKDVK